MRSPPHCHWRVIAGRAIRAAIGSTWRLLRTGQPPVYLFSDGAVDTSWNTISFDLKDYTGQTIDVLFSVMNDGLNGSTGMAIDDVQTQICVPQ